MKVLWTFNPFDKNRELQIAGEKLFTAWFGRNNTLEVVYVASNAESNLATSFAIPTVKRYSEYPKKIIQNQLKKLKLEKAKIEVLFEKSLSLSASVKKIVDYTKLKKIDLILIATNSKKLLPRVVFGSFAETLVHLSSCDLLIFHQKTKFKTHMPTQIIYAHDFSIKGANGLDKIIEYTKLWSANLYIIHVPVPEVGIELHDFKNQVQKRAKKLQKILENEKIKFRIDIKYEIHPISDILMDSAKKIKADLIAVTAQSSKLSAFLGGSVTRQVLRESSVPTLVLKV
ncbi:MAG: universal stress protein [Bacteriovorax sp.]|nr:universal stress protein [Bacteriovorax sp.]